MLVAGLLAAAPAGAAFRGNALLDGAYAAISTRTCILSPDAFVTSPVIQPQMPEDSYTESATSEGVWTFDGNGGLADTMTVVDITSLDSVPSGLTPMATTISEAGKGTYHVAKTGEVSVKVTQSWTACSISYSDAFALAGHVGSDGATVTLATHEAAIDTIEPAMPNLYLPIFEVCHRSFTLLKQ
jgi:hypothetical protein